MTQTGFYWIILAGILYGVVHSFTASLTLKNWAVRKYGEKGRRYYRLGFVLLALITTLPYAALVLLLPDARLYTINAPWITLTLLLQFVSSICLLFSLSGTGLGSFLGLDALFPSRISPQKSKLVTSGFYAATRHPIYFFSLIALWLFPVMTWNFLAFAISITIYSFIGSIFEERKMVIEFGQEYMDYQKKTPWIVPIKLK